ncbi:hypothetical protein EGJ27_23545 [Pseudomonas sp. v388]|nr:hypothetical protein EGJ27_23545 [Pseudomonas sp. v388]
MLILYQRRRQNNKSSHSNVVFERKPSQEEYEPNRQLVDFANEVQMHYTLAMKKEKYCPSFIDGVLNEVFYAGIYDEGMGESWYYVEPGETLASLPAKLILVTKDKKYDFDFRSAFGGHIISEHFFSIFETLSKGNWEIAKLDIVTPKGEKSGASNYYFIRQRAEHRESIEIIDRSNSNIDYRKTGEIKHIASLAVKPDVDKDVFSIRDTSLLGYIFFSAYAAEMLQKIELKGFEIVDSREIGKIGRA